MEKEAPLTEAWNPLASRLIVQCASTSGSGPFVTRNLFNKERTEIAGARTTGKSGTEVPTTYEQKGTHTGLRPIEPLKPECRWHKKSN
jgi:hypothetical protein